MALPANPDCPPRQSQSSLPAAIGEGFDVRIDPPLHAWQDLARPVEQTDDAMLQCVNDNARRFGSAPLEAQGLRWVTGHQAWLWHPGILAKDLAAAAAAKAWSGQVLHLVVDHDVHEALATELLLADGDALQSLPVTLAITRADLPAASQPPADMSQAIATLQETINQHRGKLVHVPQRLSEALQSLADSQVTFKTLGQQMTAITAKLMQPWTGRVAMLLTSQLGTLPSFKAMVDAMLHDASRCISAYNTAVLAHPQAGIGPLAMDRQFVELPLWLLTWKERRQPVYADITDSKPMLVLADGSPIDLPEANNDPRAPKLAPRALLLTAFMRQQIASLFVHGTGGGVYDQATESWMARWKPSAGSTQLAPMTVATADLRLPVQAPVADAADIHRAQQHLHHLSHNLNRLPGLTGEAATLASVKAELLERMKTETDKQIKASLFRQIHAINDELAVVLHAHLDDAKQELARAIQGRRNRALALRRDWLFPAYTDEALAHLRQTIANMTNTPTT